MVWTKAINYFFSPGTAKFILELFPIIILILKQAFITIILLHSVCLGKCFYLFCILSNMSIMRVIIGLIGSIMFLTGCGNRGTEHAKEDSLRQARIIDKKAVVVAGSGLTLRQTPKEPYKTTTLLPYNAIVNVLEQTNELETHQGIMGKWCKVRYLGKEGYAFGGYLKPGTEMTTPEQHHTNVEKIFNTNMQGVQQRALVHVKEGLVLRKQPATSAEKLVIIPKNEEVGLLAFLKTSEIVEEHWGNWCKVRYQDKEGYLFSGFLTFTMAKVANGEGARLREKPTVGSRMKLLISQNKKVFILSDEPVKQVATGVWYKVAYQRKQGYIFSPNLQIQGY